MVFNVSSYEYYLSDDIPIEMTVQSLLSFLERILSDDVKARGGRSLQQRIKRIFYEVIFLVKEEKLAFIIENF